MTLVKCVKNVGFSPPTLPTRLSAPLRPFSAGGMTATAIEPAVNWAGHDWTDCLPPADADRPAAGCLF